MTQTHDIAVIPTRLEDLLGFSTSCGCGKTHSVDLQHAVVRPGAIEALPDLLALLGRTMTVLVLVDARTRDVAGDRVSALLRRAGHVPRVVIVPDAAGGRPHADDDALAFAEAAMIGCDLAVSVGGGTLNDLAKLASHRAGRPYVSVATAASMNGYTSAIAAVMLGGVKRTVACREPWAVVCDLDVIRAAPRDLAASGFADLESKPTATADYRLGGVVRGTHYCPASERVVLEAEARAAEQADGIGRGESGAIGALTEALLLSGLSMRLAGSSSPASGGEHLISHHWDMTAAAEGRVEGLHGAQVGVCTIVTATLYEHLARLDPAAIDPLALASKRPSRAELERTLRDRHGPLADEVLPEYFAKHLDDAAYLGELRLLRDGWRTLWSTLGDALRPASRVRDVLARAGAPTTVAALGLRADHMRRSFVAAREIRGRFVVLDLAAELGVLESLRDSVLSDAGVLG